MSGEQKTCALVYATTLAFNLALNWHLIPIYGLNGAAMATSIAMVFEAAALYFAARSTLGLHIFIIPLRSRPKIKPEPAE
jgi:O-antigen/teichoic acid export membrane protein